MAKKLKFKYPLYIVQWDDAESAVDWQEEPLEPLAPCICTSIGFLVRDEPDRILIADSYFDGTRTISNTIKIPRGMIREMKELTVSYKTERKKRNAAKKEEVGPNKDPEEGRHSEGSVEGSLVNGPLASD